MFVNEGWSVKITLHDQSNPLYLFLRGFGLFKVSNQLVDMKNLTDNIITLV